ncbi:hypothetical protein PQF32_23740 [Rhizobium sp. BC56]|nr:hypothetical protein [Rhizobium sp. BC56]MDC7745598.1 hypothetical protein [Rhizobium sp. BC56]
MPCRGRIGRWRGRQRYGAGGARRRSGGRWARRRRGLRVSFVDGADLADAGRGQQQVAACGNIGLGLNGKRDGGIDAGELGLEGGEGLADQGGNGLRGMFEAVLLGDRHVDELTAAGDGGSKRYAAVVDMGDLRRPHPRTIG